MEQYLNSRVYYNKTSGDVICITNEVFNIEGVEIPIMEQDIRNYLALQRVSKDILVYIELEFGESYKILTKAKSYKVNIELDKPKLEVIYLTEDELKSREIVVNETVNTTIYERINDISEYASLDTTAISDLENYILLREQNKTTGGI